MKYLYTLVVLCLAFSTSAQDFPYYLYYDSEPYAEFDDGNNATLPDWDDPNAVIPLGFEFTYFDTTITQFYFSSDWLGGTITTQPDENGYMSVFMVYGSDLMDIGNVEENSNSMISYKTTGEAPNRVFHLQWADAGFYNEISQLETAGMQVNFQLRLYEGSNNMEVHYGPHSIKNSAMAHDDFPGPPMLFLPSFNPYEQDFGTIWILGGPTNDPVVTPYTIEELDDYQNLNMLQNNPSNGTVYRMTTEPLSVDELSEASLTPIYPNPSSNAFIVSMPADTKREPFKLVNLAGQTVVQGALEPGTQRIDVSELEDGIYLFRYELDGQSVTQRFIKSGR